MSNIFADIENETKDFPQEKKINFMKLTSKHTIRILEEKATKIYAHFLGGRYSVKCLGDNCPICKQTFQLISDYPETFRNEPTYSPRQKRYYVNVLDKTPVKKCPECGNEYTNLTTGICTSCSVALGKAEPSNTVKVLSKGPAVFSQFNDIHSAVLDDSGEQLGINNFDLVLVVNGRGKDTKITVIPEPHKNAPVDVEYELFDVSKAIIEVEPDEMLDLQRGVSLKDIFAARRAEQGAEFSPKESVSEEVLADVNDAVNKLFSQD